MMMICIVVRLFDAARAYTLYKYTFEYYKTHLFNDAAAVVIAKIKTGASLNRLDLGKRRCLGRKF